MSVALLFPFFIFPRKCGPKTTVLGAVTWLPRRALWCYGTSYSLI
nr:unnamed protein product [Callosobruchus analis]